MKHALVFDGPQVMSMEWSPPQSWKSILPIQLPLVTAGFHAMPGLTKLCIRVRVEKRPKRILKK
jgi:hypothetical protein